MSDATLQINPYETFEHLPNAPIVEAVIHWRAKPEKKTVAADVRFQSASTVSGLGAIRDGGSPLVASLLSTCATTRNLSDKSVRAFMQCGDNNAEFTEVLKVPAGVRVVLTSPRELLIFPPSTTAEYRTGEILVATNLSKYPSVALRCSVVPPEK